MKSNPLDEKSEAIIQKRDKEEEDRKEKAHQQHIAKLEAENIVALPIAAKNLAGDQTRESAKRGREQKVEALKVGHAQDIEFKKKDKKPKPKQKKIIVRKPVTSRRAARAKQKVAKILASLKRSKKSKPPKLPKREVVDLT